MFSLDGRRRVQVAASSHPPRAFPVRCVAKPPPRCDRGWGLLFLAALSGCLGLSTQNVALGEFVLAPTLWGFHRGKSRCLSANHGRRLAHLRVLPAPAMPGCGFPAPAPVFPPARRAGELSSLWQWLPSRSRNPFAEPRGAVARGGPRHKRERESY